MSCHNGCNWSLCHCVLFHGSSRASYFWTSVPRKGHHHHWHCVNGAGAICWSVKKVKHCAEISPNISVLFPLTSIYLACSRACSQHVSTDPHPKVKEYSISGNLLKLNFDEMVNKRSLPRNRIVEDIPSKLACLDIICKLNWKSSPSLEVHFVW